jgi:hypothetical protein
MPQLPASKSNSSRGMNHSSPLTHSLNNQLAPLQWTVLNQLSSSTERPPSTSRHFTQLSSSTERPPPTSRHFTQLSSSTERPPPTSCHFTQLSSSIQRLPPTSRHFTQLSSSAEQPPPTSRHFTQPTRTELGRSTSERIHRERRLQHHFCCCVLSPRTCMLRALHSNDRSLQNHSLATGLYDTILLLSFSSSSSSS